MNDNDLKVIESYRDKINKVMAIIEKNADDKDDSRKVLAGLYLIFGLDDAVLNDIFDGKSKMENVVMLLIEAETAFANAGIRVRQA